MKNKLKTSSNCPNIAIHKKTGKPDRMMSEFSAKHTNSGFCAHTVKYGPSNCSKCCHLAKISVLLYEIDAAKKGGSRLQNEVKILPLLRMCNEKVVKTTRKCILINEISDSFRKSGSPNCIVCPMLDVKFKNIHFCTCTVKI